MTDAITFQNQAAQGDCLLRRVNSIPQNAVEQKAVNGEHVIAHSETGHNHVIAERPDVKVFQSPNDPLLAYLEVLQSDAILEHQRSFDTHAPISIAPGKYEIRRQREYTPEGFRRAAD